MREGQDGGTSASTVTGAFPALLRPGVYVTAKSGDFALQTPARATVLMGRFDKSPYRTPEGSSPPG